MLITTTDIPRARGRRQLLVDLDAPHDDGRTLVLVAAHPHDALDAEWILGSDDEAARTLSCAVRRVARAHDARYYRVDRLLFAILGSAALDPGCVVTDLGSSVAHGAASLPADGHGAAGLRVALERLRARSRRHSRSAERQVRDVLLGVLAERRGGPDGASPRVAELAVRVGRRLALGLEALDELVRAAELQDLGKLLLPDAILHKRSAPTPEEWEEIRQHPVVAERLVAAAQALEPVARLVRSCSERFDGSGYPDGLAGDDIPLGARVIALCVAFDAMTTERPFRAALSVDAAVTELCRCAGHQFDPIVVAAFLAAGL
jgi:plasmid stability protein